jgi:ribosomal protein S18 acetylase RimI-like enzyme
LIKDKFLSSVFGYECWNLGSDVGRGLSLWHQQGRARRFGFAKVATGSEAVVGELSAHNFQLIETQVVFNSDSSRSVPSTESKDKSLLTIRPMTPRDAPLIAELAARSFRGSRFHRDVKVPKNVGDEVKRQWGKNLATGLRPSDSYVCLNADQAIVGFVSLVETARSPDSYEYTIDLIAVDEKHRQIGVGRFLVNHAQTITSRRGATLFAGTQANNEAAINLYQRNGMTLYSSSYVLHAHAPDS